MIKINSNAFGKVICSMPSELHKSAYLTFDDGPDEENTPQILDFLMKKNVNATFFITGENAEKNSQTVRAIIDQGHALGNHTYTHNNFLTLSSRAKIRREIESANRFFKEEFGYCCRIFRPCAGLKDQYIMDEAKKQGMRVIGWNRRSLDTVFKDYGKVYKRLSKPPLNNGDILLFHDSRTRLNLNDKIRVLEMIIDLYRTNGFRFSIIK